MFLSYENAVLSLLRDERHRQLMFDSYLEFDPAEAALRYKESEEFAEIRRILAQKKPAGVVLDIGAGNGILSFALAEQGYQVLALEPGNGAVTGRQAIMAIQNATGTKFEILDGWGEAIPLNDGSVDVVAARQVLHHAKDLKKMCAEVYRVLKPGGFFLALREHVIFKEGDLEIFLSKHPMHRLTGEENAYTLRFYKESMKAAGFSKLKVYAYWDSAINYAPIQTSEINSFFAEKLSQRIPFFTSGFFENHVLKIPGVSCFLRRVLNTVHKIPGSLYTFEGLK